MAETKQNGRTLADIQQDIDNLVVPDRDASPQERKDFRAAADKLSQEAAALRKEQIKNDTSLDEDDKKILSLYDKGMQNFEIAKNVFKFVNQDTVGRVVLTIRKAHADDWNEVEDVNSTKGYTGVNR